MSSDYRGSYLEGPFSEENKFYYIVHYQEYNFPGPLALTDELAFKKVKEMIDEVNSEEESYDYDFALRNPLTRECPHCRVGNKVTRDSCWNCGHDFVSKKPYFGKVPTALGGRYPWKKRNP